MSRSEDFHSLGGAVEHGSKGDSGIPRSSKDGRNLISLYHVSLRYGDFAALRDVSFSVGTGEFLFIVGPSGAGKSSALRLMSMQEQPSEGQIVVGRYLSTRVRRKDIPLLRRDVGIVFQDFKLLLDRTVDENVAFAQLIAGARRSEMKKNVSRVLNLVGLHGKRAQLARTLSGGEQQRVAIARALVNQPKIVLADEPTGNLDPEVSQDVIDLLFRVNEELGTTVVMSTHDHLLVRQFGQRIVYLERGRLVADIDRTHPDIGQDRRILAERRIHPLEEDGAVHRRPEQWETGVLRPGSSENDAAEEEARELVEVGAGVRGGARIRRDRRAL